MEHQLRRPSPERPKLQSPQTQAYWKCPKSHRNPQHELASNKGTVNHDSHGLKASTEFGFMMVVLSNVNSQITSPSSNLSPQHSQNTIARYRLQAFRWRTGSTHDLVAKSPSPSPARLSLISAACHQEIPIALWKLQGVAWCSMALHGVPWRSCLCQQRTPLRDDRSLGISKISQLSNRV